ncbi:MAG TPA: acylphosphatase [Kiritimatiellia bacterium]|nr:acylphosphatase [Kiritimatiellia bacterium]HRZ13262.1 acylphosphatase [Kiritimatiellia bacterium]HSA18711.1 acylphosphatase [Kiritimatiellia bacterium]
MKEQVQGEGTARRRVSVRYEGRVQGVGFRFTVVQVSEGFDVTGFVRNEYDGSVGLVAEGPEAGLRDFLQAIHLSPVGRHIRGEQAVWSAAEGGFHGFGVKF